MKSSHPLDASLNTALIIPPLCDSVIAQSIQVSDRPGPAKKGFAQTDGQLLGKYSQLITEFRESLPKCEACKYHKYPP
jgi:hypothetical protein